MLVHTPECVPEADGDGGIVDKFVKIIRLDLLGYLVYWEHARYADQPHLRVVLIPQLILL